MNEVDQMRSAKAELARANNAEQVLNNQAFIEAINMMEVDCLSSFVKAKQSDAKKHSEIWLQLNAIKELKANLSYIMSNGVLAKEDITFLQKAKNAMNL